MTSSKMTIDTSTPTDIVTTRTFDAPRDLVWAAHTQPEHLRAWCLGPDGWDMTVCEMDVRVGGQWRYGWARSDDGSGYFEMHGENLEVTPTTRLVHTEFFGDSPPMVVTTTFDEHDGRTTVTLVMHLPDQATRDAVLASGMSGGMEIGYDRLERLLASIRV